MLKYTETPTIEILSSKFEPYNLKLRVKREDLNHPYVSGNKWWKLKENLIEATRQKKDTLLTFGGAFSNHLVATAAAAQALKLRSIGIVRGEKILPLNPALQFAANCGMQLHFVSREAYRKKTEAAFIANLHHLFGDFYLIPEGGTNNLAVAGCAALGRLLSVEDFDFLCLPVGTGGTMAGLIEGLQGQKKIIGFPVLKGAAFLSDEISKYTTHKNWELIHHYHFGGYAKKTSALTEFMALMKNDYDLPLDFVYTAKMMFGVFDLIQKKYFPAGSKILALHTGGLQAQF